MPLTNKSNQKILLNTLEESLVKIFRLCQSLFNLEEEERQLLIEGRADDLIPIAEKKAKVLEDVEYAEYMRKDISDQLSKKCGDLGDQYTLSDLLDIIEDADVEKIRHLQQGILALQTDIREINDANYALAKLNLQHLEAVQNFIVSEIHPPSSYYGPPSSPTSEPPTNWQMDQDA